MLHVPVPPVNRAVAIKSVSIENPGTVFEAGPLQCVTPTSKTKPLVSHTARE